MVLFLMQVELCSGSCSLCLCLIKSFASFLSRSAFLFLYIWDFDSFYFGSVYYEKYGLKFTILHMDKQFLWKYWLSNLHSFWQIVLDIGFVCTLYSIIFGNMNFCASTMLFHFCSFVI